MRRSRRPVRLRSLAGLVGPYGWAVMGPVAGTLLTRTYRRRSPSRESQPSLEVGRWEAEGGALAPRSSPVP